MAEDLKNEEKSKLLYKEGESCNDGSKISHIIGREADYIVFISDDGAMCWEHRDIDDLARVALSEYEKVNAKIPSYLGQIHKNDIRPLLATALLAGFRDSNKTSESVEQCFKEVWSLINKVESRKILYASDSFYIYTNSEDLIEFASIAPNPQLGKVKSEALHYSLQAKHVLKGDKLDKANRIIASEVSEYLSNPNDNSFTKSKNFIEQSSSDSAKIYYIISSIIFSIVTLFILLMAYNFSSATSLIQPLSLGAVGGVVGALVSILQRSKTLSPEPFSSNKVLAFQGIIRGLLGVVFGGYCCNCRKSQHCNGAS